jgi:hypothetical protein
VLDGIIMLQAKIQGQHHQLTQGKPLPVLGQAPRPR